MASSSNNNCGHQLDLMELPPVRDTVGMQVAVTQQLTDLSSLLAHMISFCKMVLSQEKNTERYGPPTRYEDGSAEMEFHLMEEGPFVVMEGANAADYPPRDWPKTLD